MLKFECLGCGGHTRRLSLFSKQIRVSRDALILARGNLGRELADTWGVNPVEKVRLCRHCYQRYDAFLKTLLGLQVDNKEFKVGDYAGPIYPHFDGKDTAFRMIVWSGGTRTSVEVRRDSTYDREEFLI